MIRYVADLLNGVPSIVVGILAWAIVVRHETLLRLCRLYGAERDADTYRDAAEPSSFCGRCRWRCGKARWRSGASKWKMIATVVVPAGSKGIMTGMILGVARIAGESAPLLFTALGNQYWRRHHASRPRPAGDDLHPRIAPYEDWHRQAWAAGWFLIGMV